MQRFVTEYLNEIVSLAMLCLMIVSFIHTQSQVTAVSRDTPQESTLITVSVDSRRR